MKWRWHQGEWKYRTIVIDRYIPYPVIRWSYFPRWTIWAPWGNRAVCNFWYPSGITIHYYPLRYKLRIYYYVLYLEMYAVYKRVPDPENVDKQKYYSTLFTVSEVEMLYGEGVELVTQRKYEKARKCFDKASKIYHEDAAVGYKSIPLKKERKYQESKKYLDNV